MRPDPLPLCPCKAWGLTLSLVPPQGMGPAALTKQRILCVGAGSAGMGVVRMISKGMQVHGIDEETAQRNFWITDQDGLITKAR